MAQQPISQPNGEHDDIDYRPPNKTVSGWLDNIELFMRDPEVWSAGYNSHGLDALDESTKYIMDFPEVLDDIDGGELVIL